MRKEKIVHVPCPQQDPCFLASQCFTRKILLWKVNGSGSAWILQRETQGDNFPAFPLPQPWHPTTAYSSALDRSIPHQRELLWECIHSRRITSIHLQNPFDTFFSFNYHDNLVRKIPICQHFVKETWHGCQSRHTYNKTQTVPLWPPSSLFLAFSWSRLQWWLLGNITANVPCPWMFLVIGRMV